MTRAVGQLGRARGESGHSQGSTLAIIGSGLALFGWIAGVSFNHMAPEALMLTGRRWAW